MKTNRNLFQSFPKQIQFALIPLKLCSCVDKDLRLPHNDAMIFGTRHNNLQGIAVGYRTTVLHYCIQETLPPSPQHPQETPRFMHRQKRTNIQMDEITYRVISVTSTLTWKPMSISIWHQRITGFWVLVFPEATTCSMTRKDLHDFASRRLRNARI